MTKKTKEPVFVLKVTREGPPELTQKVHIGDTLHFEWKVTIDAECIEIQESK